MGIDPEGKEFLWNAGKNIEIAFGGGKPVGWYKGDNYYSWQGGIFGEEEITAIANATAKYQLVYNEEWKNSNKKGMERGMYILDREKKKLVLMQTTIFNPKNRKSEDNNYVYLKRGIFQDSSIDEKAINILISNYGNYKLFGNDSRYVDMGLITLYKDL